jgi:predicted Fe-Mo cluster-binding NifX family protein
MKIAFATDDGQIISKHFGRARYYEVVDLDGGRIVKRERRDKPGHHTHAPGDHSHHTDHSSPEAEQKHASMLSPIQDCCILVAGGMGTGAYRSIMGAGLEPYVVMEGTIDEAIEKLAKGTLENHTERLH